MVADTEETFTELNYTSWIKAQSMKSVSPHVARRYELAYRIDKQTWPY